MRYLPAARCHCRATELPVLQTWLDASGGERSQQLGLPCAGQPTPSGIRGTQHRLPGVASALCPKGVRKSGGFSADDPNADFYRSFFADPLVHLPAGDWTLTAVASLVDGYGGSGESYTLRAAVLVHVTA